jgi:hypothetical protein
MAKAESKRGEFQVCESAEECEIAHQPSASRVRLLQALKDISEWGNDASLESAKAYAAAVYAHERG